MKHNITPDLVPLATDVSKLVLDPRNARQHSENSVESVARSLSQFGQRKPIVVRRGSNTVEAGNGTLTAARALGWSHVAAVFVEDDDTTATAYAIADNRTAELSTWNKAALTELLSEIRHDSSAVESTGFTPVEVSMLLDSILTDSQAESAPQPTAAHVGDVWSGGGVEVVCGDAQSIRAPASVGCLFFDPPWDSTLMLDYECASPDSTLAFCDGQRLADVVTKFGAPTWLFVWDCMSSWHTPNRPLKRSKLCAWYGSIANYANRAGTRLRDGDSRVVKNTRGASVNSPAEATVNLSDLYSDHMASMHGKSNHSHSKPLPWVRSLIANTSQGLVFDPFMGSGVSMLAAWQLGRPAFGIELNPEVFEQTVSGLISAGVPLEKK